MPIVSPFGSYFDFFRQRAFSLAAVLILVLSGTTYASAHSLPGSLLYGMKVNLVEPIGLALRFTEESKNQYKISLLEKRVEELERLREKGSLEEDTQRASAEATGKNVKELETSAVFNEEGENIDVSENIRIYNNLIDSELKIETKIKIDTNEETNGHEEAIDDPILDLNKPEALIDQEGSTIIEEHIEIDSGLETTIPEL